MSNEKDLDNLCDVQYDPWTPKSDKFWLIETTVILSWNRCSNIKNLMVTSTGSRCKRSSSSYNVVAFSSSPFEVRHPQDIPYESERGCRVDIKSRKSSRDKTTLKAFHRWSLGMQIERWWPKNYIKMLMTQPLTSNSIDVPQDRTQMSISVKTFDVMLLRHILSDVFVCGLLKKII